jgi:hypothetical protein
MVPSQASHQTESGKTGTATGVHRNLRYTVLLLTVEIDFVQSILITSRCDSRSKEAGKTQAETCITNSDESSALLQDCLDSGAQRQRGGMP